jgi:NAD(P)-dependent dehydrogenase (short-subunit alcohol dehydrogenase family)
VLQLTRNLALEWGKQKIRVNSISPGIFEPLDDAKDFFKNLPVPRPGDPYRDLTGPVLLLASEAGAYITGTDICVDGGLSVMRKSPVAVKPFKEHETEQTPGKHAPLTNVIPASELFSMKGKTVLITGASSGIGAHLAYFMAMEGANVILAARRTEKLDQVMKEIHKLPGNMRGKCVAKSWTSLQKRRRSRRSFLRHGRNLDGLMSCSTMQEL